MVREKNSLMIDDTLYETEVPDRPVRINRRGLRDSYEIRAVIPGIVSDIIVREGQKIFPGQVVIILEAMKMLNDVESETGGEVAEIKVSKGNRVEKGQLLIKLKKA